MGKIHRSILAALAVFILSAYPLQTSYAQAPSERPAPQADTEKPWLGVSIQDVTPDVALKSPGTQGGVVVSEVKDGSPADQAGIKEGDIIVSLNGQKIDGVDDFVSSIQKQKPGNTVVLGISRDNTVRDMTVALAPMPGYAMMGMMGMMGRGGYPSMGADHGSCPQMGAGGGCPHCPRNCPMMGGGMGECPHQMMGGGKMGMSGMGAMCPHEMKGMSPGAGYGKMYMRAIRELKLTPDQKKKAEALRSEYKKKAIKSKADIKIAEIELRELAKADPVSLEKVKAKINEISTKKADLRLMRYRSLEDLKKILTSEQRQKIRDMYSMAYEGERDTDMGHEMDMEEDHGEQ